MADLFDEDDELEFEIVTMIGEHDEEVEFSIIDHVLLGKERYLLVIETDELDNEEAEALILREVSINTNDVTYEIVEEDAEFQRVAELFSQKGEDYDIEIQ